MIGCDMLWQCWDGFAVVDVSVENQILYIRTLSHSCGEKKPASSSSPVLEHPITHHIIRYRHFLRLRGTSFQMPPSSASTTMRRSSSVVRTQRTTGTTSGICGLDTEAKPSRAKVGFGTFTVDDGQTHNVINTAVRKHSNSFVLYVRFLYS